MKNLLILLSFVLSLNAFSADDVAVKCRKEIDVALHNYISSGWSITGIYHEGEQEGVSGFQVYLSGYQLDILEHIQVENETCRVF